MKMLAVILCTLLFTSLASAAGNCFVLGQEGSFPFPPTGYSQVTLPLLQGSLGSAFISQYNSGGIPFLPGLNVGNCLTTFGALQCAYAPNNIEPFVAYTLSGLQQCIWTSPPGPVKLGTWSTGQWYNTVNQSLINTWTTTTCPTTLSHYTLLYNTSCGSNPTPPPPVSNSTCCYYFSHPLDYQTALCQKAGFTCPNIIGFVLVYNQTVSSCAQCTVTSLPANILHKYSNMPPHVIVDKTAGDSD